MKTKIYCDIANLSLIKKFNKKNIVKNLNELKKLHEKGVINNEEFLKAKKKILD